MCDIAPFQMKCAFEDGDLMVCACHKLSYAVTELKQGIPFLGKFVPDYHCPHFETDVEKEVKDNE